MSRVAGPTLASGPTPVRVKGMGGTGRTTVVGWLLRWASGLRFRTLTFLTLALFAADLVVPDTIPFVDELLLGLATLLLASLRKRREPDGGLPVPTR